MIQAVDECPKCGALISPTDVKRRQTAKNNTFLIWTCACGETGQTLFSSDAYQEYLKKVRQWAGEGKLVRYNPEWVGRTVQGFRIDLDTIETVSDIELEWYDDRRYRVAVQGRR